MCITSFISVPSVAVEAFLTIDLSWNRCVFNLDIRGVLILRM